MTYKFDDFQACLNQAYSLGPALGDLQLELISVERHPHGDAVDGKDAFTIMLRGPAEPVLAQQTYTMRNENMGEFDLFIVPIGPDDQGMCYEAVFS